MSNNETHNSIKIILTVAIAIPLCLNGLFWGWNKWIQRSADDMVKIIQAQTVIDNKKVEDCLGQENTYWNGRYCEYKKPEIR